MQPVRRLGNEEARRIAVRAQLLSAERPSDLVGMIEHLTFVQLDPTAAVAPSADLVAWSRLGPAYRPEHMTRAHEIDRTLFHHRGQDCEIEPAVVFLRPMRHLGLFLAAMGDWPGSGAGRHAEWMATNDPFRRRILDQLRAEGPLPSKDIPDTAVEPWISSGWTNDRNVTQMLEFLSSRGEVAVAGRKGRQRLWDVAERVYPSDVEVLPVDEARRRRDESRLRALGIARPVYVGDAGVPAAIEGTAGEWRVDPEASADGFEGRTALLSPFDRLLHDRTRALDLFGFEYVLEMYKPKDKRRWGYFALPVLHHDRLVGKVDATLDRKAGALRVDAVHPDVKLTKPMTKAILGELDALAAWLGVERRGPV